jgi:hypothetical protein
VEEDQVERILNMDAGMAASGEETEG